MNTDTIHIGSDASKGYADFRFIDQEGHAVHEDEVIDDTPEGHTRFRNIVEQLNDRFEDPTFKIGVESTGGFERNWLDCFKDLANQYECEVYQINPDLICRFKQLGLHNISTDPISAGAIAEYLRKGLREQDETFDPEYEGLRTRARLLFKTIDYLKDLKNEFQSLLPQTHPQLVSNTRDGIPKWVLRVLKQFPSVDQLADAAPETVAQIPYVTIQRARNLVKNAGNSVAGRRDDATSVSIQHLAGDILSLMETIDSRKQAIYEELADDPGVQILMSIPGIAEWSASVLRLEIGDIIRFPNPEKLVAYSGLDPLFDESGDDEDKHGISKQGNRFIRRILFPCVQSGVQKNPPIRSFYNRLRKNGKEHMVAMTACMRKLLCIAYACWAKNEPFDPEYEKQLKKRIEKKKQQNQDSDGNSNKQHASLDTSAPVSKTEAKRRKKMKNQQQNNQDKKKEARPQKRIYSSIRGQ